MKSSEERKKKISIPSSLSFLTSLLHLSDRVELYFLLQRTALSFEPQISLSKEMIEDVRKASVTVAAGFSPWLNKTGGLSSVHALVSGWHLCTLIAPCFMFVEHFYVLCFHTLRARFFPPLTSCYELHPHKGRIFSHSFLPNLSSAASS